MSIKRYAAMAAMLAGISSMGYTPYKTSQAYIPFSRPIPFTFKKFKRKEKEDLPKGCKCERLTLKFIKPSSPIKYRISVEVDIIYGTTKARRKRLLQYQNEIAYFIYCTPINKLEDHKGDILIEEVIEELKVSE